MFDAWFIPHVTMVAGAVLSVLALAQMLRQRRSPSSTMAWFLAIVALPYVGVPLYLMFGGRKLRRLADAKDDLRLSAHAAIPRERAGRLDQTLRSYGIPGATAGNRMTLCPTGDEALRALLGLVDAAERSIHVETFIFSSDDAGQEVLQQLASRAGAGLEVRLLVDGVGSIRTPRRFFQPLIEAGGKFAVFNPVLHLPFVRRTNLRNHRKITVVDGRRVFAGGMNITGEDLYAAARPGVWKDLSFVVEGPVVRHFGQVFRSDWTFATGEVLAEVAEPGWADGSADGVALQVVPSGPDVPNDPLLDTILMAIYSAKERVWIVTPYFVPDESIEQALIIACHRGVEVNILVPEKSNHLLADVARRSFLRDIEHAGGTIWQYAAGMVHAKLVIVDRDVAMVGSANLDMRSLLLNFEIMQFVYGRPEIDAIDQWVQALTRQSKTGMPAAGPMGQIVEGLTRLVEPQL